MPQDYRAERSLASVRLYPYIERETENREAKEKHLWYRDSACA